MGSLITREKRYTRTHTITHTQEKHTETCACTEVDIFSQLHCSLRLAHLDIRGSRTHYQLGGMKGAHGGRRSKRPEEEEEEEDQEEKEGGGCRGGHPYMTHTQTSAACAAGI